jgi:hypothetical protein
MASNLRKELFPENIDYILSLSGLAFGILIVVFMICYHMQSQLGVPITIFSLSASYLLFNKKLSTSNLHNEENRRKGNRNYKLLSPTSLLLLFVIVSFLTIWISNDSIKRPLWVFFVLSILPGFIIFQNINLIDDRYILFQIIVMNITLYMATVTVFPYDGGDTWVHLHNAISIQQNLTIRSINDAYLDYPLYPALIALFSDVANLNPGDIARYLNGASAVICTLLLYSLAKKIFSSSNSVVLILLLIGSKYYIYWFTKVVSMSFSLVFYCFLVAILFRRYYKKLEIKETLLLILISTIIPFVHPVVSITSIFLFFGIWFIERFLSRTYSWTQHSLWIMTIFVIIATLIQWMYFGKFIFDRTILSFVNAIFRDGEVSLVIPQAYRSFKSTMLDEANFYLLLWLSGFEILNQLRNKKEITNLIFGLVGFGIVGFGYLVKLFSILAAVPDRWFLFGSILLVFPAFSTLHRLIGSNRFGQKLSIVIIILYYFSGLANNQVNKDHQFYSENWLAHTQITHSQFAGLQFMGNRMEKIETHITTDSWLYDYLKYLPGNDILSYWDLQWNPVEISNMNGILSKRPSYFETPQVGFSNMTEFPVEFEEEYSHLSQIYDSGDIQWLDRVPVNALINK